MLQVTFRGLLPSEALMAVASDWYARLPRSDRRLDRLCCYVTISSLGDPHSSPHRYRTVIEVAFGTTTVLRADAEGVDPDATLRNGLSASNATLARMGMIVPLPLIQANVSNPSGSRTRRSPPSSLRNTGA